MEPATGKISVTKLDAARRQLRLAIRLWFAGGDPVAIYTLASAGHEIIDTLSKRKGLDGVLFDSPFISEEHRSKVRQLLVKPYNFFKHADRDPDGRIEFNPEANEILLVACASALKNMGETPGIEEIAIAQWVILRNPEAASDEPYTLPLEILDVVRPKPKAEFFQFFDEMHRRGLIIPAAG